MQTMWGNSNGSWVTWVMVQLTGGSHGSWVSKVDPQSALPRRPCTARNVDYSAFGFAFFCIFFDIFWHSDAFFGTLFWHLCTYFCHKTAPQFNDMIQKLLLIRSESFTTKDDKQRTNKGHLILITQAWKQTSGDPSGLTWNYYGITLL